MARSQQNSPMVLYFFALSVLVHSIYDGHMCKFLSHGCLYIGTVTGRDVALNFEFVYCSGLCVQNHHVLFFEREIVECRTPCHLHIFSEEMLTHTIDDDFRAPSFYHLLPVLALLCKAREGPRMGFFMWQTVCTAGEIRKVLPAALELDVQVERVTVHTLLQAHNHLFFTIKTETSASSPRFLPVCIETSEFCGG